MQSEIMNNAAFSLDALPPVPTGFLFLSISDIPLRDWKNITKRQTLTLRSSTGDLPTLPSISRGSSSPGLIRHQKGCGCALLLTIAEVRSYPMLPVAIFRYLRGSKKRNPGLCVCMCAYYCYDYYYHYYYYYLLMWVKQ